MKKCILTLLAIMLISTNLFASEGDSRADSTENKKKDIVKKGFSIGPLPIVAFDADKGFQLGALLNLYDFGDGSQYPNMRQKLYFEASFFTKGSQLFVLSYDNKFLIPGVRWSSSLVLANEKAMDFYGFNGYMSYYDYERIAMGKDKKNTDPNAFIYSPMYRKNRLNLLFKSDFTGNIWKKKLFWEAGYQFNYIKVGYKDRQALNLDKINKNKAENKMYPATEPTLFDLYRKWGIIPEDEAWGGFNSILRLGLLFDTRDKESAPSKGIWAEGHVTIAPKWLGTSVPHYRYSLTFRHYVPIVKNDVLTFAYRLNYEGTFGNKTPYYAMPFITVMGAQYDRDGMGGYRTVRGLLRNRVQGLDMATYNVEFRWRFVSFKLWKQNIAFGLNVFSDGTMVTRKYDMSFKATPEQLGEDFTKVKAAYDAYMEGRPKSDRPHITFGGGLRFIMNQNFIVAFEYGMPVSRFCKDPVIKKQDGNGAFYINTGFLF